MKKSLLVGAAIATVVASSGGLAMAATSSTSTSGDSLAQKIASKFGLNVSDVQSVIDQNRQAHEAQREANFKANLVQAVKDGKLAQAQSDHITSVMSQIDTLRGSKTPDQLDQSTKDQIKKLRDDLRQWAKDNNVNFKYIFAADHHGMGMGHAPKSDSSNSSN